MRLDKLKVRLSLVKLSIILATAREDFSMINLPQTHLFHPTISSLQKQTFRDFEFILIDGLFEQRRDYFIENPTDFPVIHIPPKPSPYLARGQWSVCDFLNTGLIVASGKYVLRLDDTDEFDADFLQNNINYLDVGYFPLTMEIYYRGGKTASYDALTRKYYAEQATSQGQMLLEGSVERKLAVMDKLYAEGAAIQDSRFGIMGESYVMAASWEQVYGNMAIPLEIMLQVNGYDEAFDGKKSLEDPDLGLRVVNLMGKSKFILDKRLTVIEHFHGSASPHVIWNPSKPACCNYAILKLHERNHTIRGNERKFTEGELQEIKTETVKSPCSHVEGRDYDTDDGFQFWSQNIPIFDLREFRYGISGSVVEFFRHAGNTLK